MEYRPLGQTGLEVSSIGLGCVTFGREIDKATSFDVLDHALERGINLLDTAEAYAAGESERVVGEWMADRGVRDRVVLATKVSGTLTRERVITSAEESLQRLGVDVIDLFQLHVFDDSTPVDETLAALDTLVEQGKVKHVGCSNWGAWQLAHALLRFASEGGARMESVQPPYNLVQREIEGFILTRLQGVLLREAWALLDEGYASADDIDKTVREGLGLRWSFLGPFETIDLNAPGGVREYAEVLGPLYHSINASRSNPKLWSEGLIAKAEVEMRAKIPAEKLEERRNWRDRRLMALAAHKKAQEG